MGNSYGLNAETNILDEYQRRAGSTVYKFIK